MMKRFITASLINSLLLTLLLSCLFVESTAAADTMCGRGTGEPPFLSYGVESNLLMMLDNSGSMLDMAYLDQTDAAAATATGVARECFDESYMLKADGTPDPDKTYGGYFTADQWYVWNDATSLPTNITTWSNSRCYDDGDLVWDNNQLYKAECIGANKNCNWDAANAVFTGCGPVATDTSLTTDNLDELGTSWIPYFSFLDWRMGVDYPAGTFVKYENQLYYTAGGGMEDDDHPLDETFAGADADWIAVDHTWLPGHGYSANDIVSYNGMIYYCNAGSNSTTFDYTAWSRIEEGAFQEYTTDTIPCGAAPSFATSDVQITVLGNLGNKVTSANIATNAPASVDCFAAKGNFLNWASASKFDIQKKILTGGKLYEGIEGNKTDYTDSTWDDDRLVGEHRGCGGSYFGKQITLNATSNVKLTLGIRGGKSKSDDWLGTVDNTTRIEVVGVTVGGFDDTKCRYAVYVSEHYGEPCCNQKTVADALAQCTNGVDSKDLTAEAKNWQIYHSAVHNCIKGTYNKTQVVSNFCEDLYRGFNGFSQTFPWEIAPKDPSYVCYGEYTDTTSPYNNGTGYMGRLWKLWRIASNCSEVCDCSTSNPDISAAATGGPWTAVGEDCEWVTNDKKIKYTCESNILYYRTKSGNTWSQTSSFYDAVGGTFCASTSGGLNNECLPNPPGWPDTGSDCWTDPKANQALSFTNALKDYCGRVEVPEVIDPTDQASSTTGAGNIPASLIDSGLYNQMGLIRPLAVMKGYVDWDIPLDQQTDIVQRPDGPRGVLYAVSSDLRLGVMAFRDNGSKTECEKLATAQCGENNIYNYPDSCVNDADCFKNGDPTLEFTPNAAGCNTDCSYCMDHRSINKFCPESNGDGARVLANVESPMYLNDVNNTPDITSDDVEVWDHYKNIVTAINDTRATSWTPLAEAVYTAIGYYSQISTRRLNSDPVDDTTSWDFQVETEINTYNSATDYGKGMIVENGGDYFQTVTGGKMPLPGVGVAGWSKIRSIDPTQNWCQENHLLIITEGASTADINSKVAEFVTLYPDNDSNDGSCVDGQEGSTYLDDLTGFAHYTYAEENDADHIAAAKALYGVNEEDYMIDEEIRKDITTHIVVAGNLRGDPDSSDECIPAKIMTDAATQGGSDLIVSADPQQLETDLAGLLGGLQNRASAGSAASVISSSRGGEGAIYQAIFWPEKKLQGVTDDTYTVDWAGDVHALFIDSHGLMYEDTDQDAQFDEDDKQITVYYDESLDNPATMACYGSVTEVNGVAICSATSVPIEDVEFLWSAADWLSGADGAVLNTAGNRTSIISDVKKRYLYTWNDLNNDGIVDRDSEWLPFEDVNSTGPVIWSVMSVSNDRSSVLTDFDVGSDEEVNKIVKWMRGADDLEDPTLRSRLTKDKDGNDITWRLGDVIHSTPMTVTSPAEAYHLLYNDYSYAQFFAHWKQRRQVIYFGGNDGMLHAVNGGFYHADSKTFCRELNINYNITDNDTTNDNPCINSGPSLGAELWGYVPYNLLPHLKCMIQKNYTAAKKNHKYYVDLRPRIFDVQIFADNDTHPNGWGTILVGGMRLGGAPVDAEELTGVSTVSGDPDPRQFISSYFIFDITDPESPPVLLGETTRWLDGRDLNGDHVDLGHSSNISTMVIMKKDGISSPAPANAYAEADGSHNQWYLILGSGPHGEEALKGVSDQTARIAVLPLDWLVETSNSLNSTRRALRIPAAEPTLTVAGGRFVLDPTPDDTTDPLPNGFTGNLITVDFDINPSQEDYMADAVYFGTVEGDFVGEDWSGGGRLYRLLTRAKSPDPSGSGPDGWFLETSVTQDWSTPDKWTMTTMINNGQPITAAPSVGFDGYNYWVYFGTGRFFDANDKTDDTQQSFYGIKEPMDPVADSTAVQFWGRTVVAPTVHGTPSPREWPVAGNDPGYKGLLKVDEIRVAEAASASAATLSCREVITGLDCIPDNTNVTSLADLIEYTAGKGGGDPAWSNSSDGWYYDFYPYGNRERNVGQATLFGGLVLFTTFQPYSDVCKAEGDSYLYALYYQTGTAWNEVIFGGANGGAVGRYSDGAVREKLGIGPGLATTPNLHTSGDGDTVKAFLQSSTGEIIPIEHETATGDTSSGRTGWKECAQ